MPLAIWSSPDTDQKRNVRMSSDESSSEDTLLHPSTSLVGTLVRHTRGRDPRVVVSTAAFHARVRGSVPGLGGLKETKNVSSPSTCESQYCG